MGFFGSYLYADGHWQEEELAEEPTTAEPWLHVLVHGSDFTAITYRPAGPGSGVAFLGYTPRSLFETEDASAPTDVVREAVGLASWWALLGGVTSDEVTAAKSAQLIGYLAEDIDPATKHRNLLGDLDEADVFVEIKTSRFIAALDLPILEDLPAG